MPNQCVHCGKIYETISKELLEGCTCGSHFFFFVKSEQLEKMREENAVPIEMTAQEKIKVEKDVREIIGVKEEEPVILDFESVRVIKPGKFELDIVNLFRKDRPLIYKLEEGKYIIDLASTLKVSLDEIQKKIVNPDK